MNWKNKFGLAWEDAFSPKWMHPADGIQEFISVEIIEKIIEDIPDWNCPENLKQQLKDKWL
jgi:hypothetical protein